MRTDRHAHAGASPAVDEAVAIIGKCVHCGFCLPACPTYRLLGDERDSPRGRIYLIKQVLEGASPTSRTQLHLDRCLTCRACETACPSGVQFGRLVDTGRALVDERVSRPAHASLTRRLLALGLTSAAFGMALRAARALRPLLPGSLRRRIPVFPAAKPWPRRHHDRKMLLLRGCVQSSLAPNIDAATARVFDASGIELIDAPGAVCCGAIRRHLGDHARSLEEMRRNIDAWWPHLERGAEAIVVNASGCGSMAKEYGHLLRDDPVYATKAARVSAATIDPSEALQAFAAPLASRCISRERVRVAFHAPCSLQHAQRITGVVEHMLEAFGAEIVPVTDAALCCGSAGTYSLLQPAIATELRSRKLASLLAAQPAVVLSANIGCIAHLASASPVTVRHWIEWLDERMGA